MTLNEMRLEYARLHNLWNNEQDPVKRDDLWDQLQDLMDAMTEAKEGR